MTEHSGAHVRSRGSGSGRLLFRGRGTHGPLLAGGHTHGNTVGTRGGGAVARDTRRTAPRVIPPGVPTRHPPVRSAAGWARPAAARGGPPPGSGAQGGPAAAARGSRPGRRTTEKSPCDSGRANG